MKTPETKPHSNVDPNLDSTTDSSAALPVQLPCRFLRCKEMYYGAPEDDAFAGGAYWCERTQEVFGPDGESCGQKQCCANRTCYVT